MNKLKKIVLYILTSTAFLYLVGFILFKLSVDTERSEVKVLNYLRGSVRHVSAFYSKQEEYDRIRFKQSADYYERVFSIMPWQKFTAGALGYCYYYLGNTNKAVDYFKRALKENSMFFGYYYDLGQIYFNGQKWKKAEDSFKKATSVGLDANVLYFTMARDRLFKGGLEGEVWFNTMLLSLKKAYDNSLKKIIIIFDKQKKYEDVVSAAIKGIELNADDDGFFSFYLGKALYELGQYSRAYIMLDKCLDKNPDYTQAYKYKSLILDKKGNKRLSEILSKKAGQMAEYDGHVDNDLMYFIPLYELGG